MKQRIHKRYRGLIYSSTTDPQSRAQLLRQFGGQCFVLYFIAFVLIVIGAAFAFLHIEAGVVTLRAPQFDFRGGIAAFCLACACFVIWVARPDIKET